MVLKAPGTLVVLCKLALCAKKADCGKNEPEKRIKFRIKYWWSVICSPREKAGKTADCRAVIYVIHQLVDMFQKGRPYAWTQWITARRFLDPGAISLVIKKEKSPMGHKYIDGIKKVTRCGPRNLSSEFTHRPKNVQRNDH